MTDSAVFSLFTNAVKSNRDDWVFDFDVGNLRDKALFFADTYNEFLGDGERLMTRLSSGVTRYKRGLGVVNGSSITMQTVFKRYSDLLL